MSRRPILYAFVTVLSIVFAKKLDDTVRKSGPSATTSAFLMDALLLTKHGSDLRNRAYTSVSKSSPKVSSSRSFRESCYPFSSVAHDFLLKNERFLPEPNDAGPCRLDTAAIALRNHLQRLGEQSCRAQHQFTTDNVGYGFGSVINSWIKPYMYAVDHSLSFWSPPLGSYRDGQGFGQTSTKFGKRCKLDSMACWLRPMSKCELAPSLLGESRDCLSRRGGSIEPRRRSCIPRIIAENRSLNSYSLMHRKNDKDGFPRSIPDAYKYKGHFWYVSMLQGFMLHRPNEHFLKIIISSKVAAGFYNQNKANESHFKESNTLRKVSEDDGVYIDDDGSQPQIKYPQMLQQQGISDDIKVARPILSLHVRRGDSCNPEQIESKKRKCDSLKVYMDQAVLPMSKLYGVQSIFLATDDEAILKETNEYPQFRWLWIKGQDRSDLKKGKWEANLRRNQMDNYDEAQQALLDLYLMAEGDMFVGKFTSNLDRIAYSLMVSRANGLRPYISLDSKWCSDWGRKVGRSHFGEFFC